MSEQALKYRSFSGGSFAPFCPLDCDTGGRVIVCVAIARICREEIGSSDGL